MENDRPLVGVLALQGGYTDHAQALGRLGGVDVRLVRVEDDLAGLDGLILPGGESTAVGRLLRLDGFGAALREAAAGLPCWGTCMGAILLAERIAGGDAAHLGLMDITVERNAYGSQLDSFVAREEIAGVPGGPFPLVFIRAPVIAQVGAGVEVLARHGGRIIACRQGNLVATAFHPELSGDDRFHAWFLGLVRDGRVAAA
jgi:5'-phosphate synthase pdxT subunit